MTATTLAKGFLFLMNLSMEVWEEVQKAMKAKAKMMHCRKMRKQRRKDL